MYYDRHTSVRYVSYNVTLVCSFIRRANPFHHLGFPWLLLRCSCVVKYLAFSTP